MANVVTLTMNPAIDKSTHLDRVMPDRKLRCSKPAHEPGGGGINVTRALHELGIRSRAIFPAGGPSGEMLDLLMDQEAVEHVRVPVQGWTRQNLTVLEENGAQQYRFNMPGPNLKQEEWEDCLEIIAGLDPFPAYVVASGSLPPGVPDDFYGRLAKSCHDQGGKAVLDTSGEPLRRAMKSGAYLVKPNLRELKQIVGEGEAVETELEQIVMDLINAEYAEVMVVSLGAAGALLASREGTHRIQSPTVPIVSKIGAGDSMVAGIVYGLVDGKTLPDAVRFGVAAGAAAVMTPGTELLRKEDAFELYRRLTHNSQKHSA